MTMRRSHVLALMAVAIFSVGLSVFIARNSRLLAAETFVVGPSRVRFAIEVLDDGVYVSAREVRTWGHGWRTMTRVGSVEEIGIANATIIKPARSRPVQLQVGRSIVEFDLSSRRFVVP